MSLSDHTLTLLSSAVFSATASTATLEQITSLSQQALTQFKSGRPLQDVGYALGVAFLASPDEQLVKEVFIQIADGIAQASALEKPVARPSGPLTLNEKIEPSF